MGIRPARANGAATSWRKLLDQRLSDRFSKQERARRLIDLAWGFVCVATLVTVGCSRPVEPLPLVAIEHEISPQPARVGPVSVTLKLAAATGKPLTGARIALEADMSHAGMSPFIAEAKETERGRYHARLEFSMAGDWVILLLVTLSDRKKLERQIDVGRVRPNKASC